MRWTIVIALAACGRIGFGSIGDRTGDGAVVGVTSGPTQQTTFSAYLFSSPLVATTAGREIWTWQGDFNSAAPFSVSQACP